MYKWILLLFIVSFVNIAYAEKFTLLNELNSVELSVLDKGELLLRTKEVLDSPWPEITIYSLVAPSPLESIGIFSALDYQKDYVPNVIKSKPIKHISSVEDIVHHSPI